MLPVDPSLHYLVAPPGGEIVVRPRVPYADVACDFLHSSCTSCPRCC